MLGNDKISERFDKWDNKNWHTIEKDLTVFQKKVADTMIRLGSFEYVPEQQNPCLEDESVLGQELYVDLVRPRLYKMDFVPKDKKEKKDDPKKDKAKEKTKKVEDSDDEEEKDEPVVVKEEVKEAKKPERPAKKEKPKKAPKPKKEDLMKQQIIKETFAKQIDFAFKTFSMENIQIEFGFRQKKLELKISTFFYIACFIRKNKVKQQIDESVIMELINILIKVYKIFKDYEGKSFLDSTTQIPVSAKCMQDLKSCMDGLIQYYGYNIKKVINKYPKLVYYTEYDKYFPTLDIKPYNSQIEFVKLIKDSLTSDKPSMLFYKTMIGSGKTTASISVANLISEMKILNDKQNKHLQLIYCCVIKSVRAQVGKLAYNEGQKFALGAMDTLKNRKNLENKTPEQEGLCDKEPYDFFPRIINSWSCEKAQIVDLLISDLYTTKEFLSESKINPRIKIKKHGKVERENIILFVDEPTAFCSATSSVTAKLFEILSECPPKIIVFASATMPEKEQLTKTINLIRQRNPDIKVSDVSSKEFQIGCQFCTFEGQIIYPHSDVTNKAELEETINLLGRNPFLMRLYTGPSLFSLLDRCKKAGLKKMPDLENFMEIRQTDILKETINMLTELTNSPDEVIEKVCKADKDLDNIAKDEEDNTEESKKKKAKKDQDDDDIDFGGDDEPEAKKRPPYVNLKKLLKSDAYKFLGGCLIATEDPISFAQTAFSKWIDGIPSIKKLLDRYERDKIVLREKLDAIDETKELRPEQKAKKKAEVENQFQPKFDFPETKRINTSAHYQKYCKNRSPTHNSKLIRPIIIEIVGLELFAEVEDWMIQMLFCGVAIYSKKVTSSLYLNKVDELAASGYLAYIICDESLCYGTNFPISNVILTDSLATKLTINELFQLMGRAGRVGQSWTARAFLDEEGAAKLKDYIKTKDKTKYSSEAEIFEQIAERLLENPPLLFKNKRYLITPAKDDPKYITVAYREHFGEDGERAAIDKICLVAYAEDSKILSTVVTITESSTKTSRTVYRLFSGRLKACDLPTTTSPKGQKILNVSLFYQSDEKFMAETYNNAIQRIVSETFKSSKLVSVKNTYNYLTADNFLNFAANAYISIVRIEGETASENGLKYEYNSINLESGPRMISDFNLKEIGKLSNEDNDETKKAGHLKMIETCESYKDYFNNYVGKIITKEAESEHILAETLDNMIDLAEANETEFAVDRLARPLWSKICAEIKK